MSLQIDRSLVSESEAFKLDTDLDNAAARRERNLDAGVCINENNQGTHGPATHGCRCLRCYLVHKFGAEVIRLRGVHAVAREHGIDITPITTTQQGA